MSNYKVYVGNNSNQAQYVGQILDDASVTRLANVATFPAQSGQSGKFLTTNGSEVSWANVSALPSQSGQSGKFLTTNGSTASWGTIDALPSQSGQGGKYLTTNGTTASWATIDALPSQASNSGKFLTTNGSASSWADLPVDSSTITKNLSTGNLQASGILNKNTASGATASCFDWVGTLQEYNDQTVATSHPEWICYITDDITGGASVYTKSESDSRYLQQTANITSIQLFATEAAAQTASLADSTKLCLYPAS